LILILARGLFAALYSAKVMAGFQGIANQVGVIWAAVVTVAAMEKSQEPAFDCRFPGTDVTATSSTSVRLDGAVGHGHQPCA
jgi:hypothetical protein